MRHLALAAGLILAIAGNHARAQTPETPTPPAPAPPAAPPTVTTPATPSPTAIGLEEALKRFPPLIIGGNVTAITEPNKAVPPSCPKTGSRVEQKGGPTMLFLGTSNGNPDLCHMKVGDDEMDAWFGIWGNTWPGGDVARRAIERAYHNRTGDVVGFDTVAQAGVAEWHDLIRNDGVEEIPLLGKTYRALKLAHYREGYNGNTYRSVATLWVDLDTGLPLYATYQHIAGRPELDSPLIPTAIVPAP
jgi:hypothetical protein